ncbi:MAG: phospholipid carrier-dependent glycosyltransferase [Myxococcales bacterium]|nr:phospholipid carrier-dependent glycosyltransferase [Myxococcales bacterium]
MSPSPPPAAGWRAWWRRHGPTVLAALGVWAVALAVRLPDLDASVNIDAAWQWFRRTRAFWQALAAGDPAGTFQVHPGVTLMWLAGASLQLGPGLAGPLTPAAVAAGALPVAWVSSLIAPGSVVLTRRILGPRALDAAATLGLLLATEPFLVGHGRTAHLDALLTTFAWLGAGAALWTWRRGRWSAAALAGACLGLAVLTKVAGGAVALGVGLTGLLGLVRPRRGRRLARLAAITGVALLVAFALWPALRAAPVDTLDRLVAEVTSQVDRGHRVYFGGLYYAQDPGPAYYLAVLGARLTPEVLLLALAGAVIVVIPGRRRAGARRALAALLGAYAVLLYAQVEAPKKIDRYVLPFFPLFAATATVAVVALTRRLARGRRWLALTLPLALLGVPRLARLAAVHPHAIAWSQDWPGWPAGRAVTLGFGEGLREAALWIAGDAQGHRPRVFSGMYRPCLEPWLDFREARLADAEYQIRYISVIQRGFRAKEYAREMRGLLHQVVIDGRVWVEIHAGPRYRGPTTPGYSVPWKRPPTAPKR